jgi:hypothetical protein
MYKRIICNRKQVSTQVFYDNIIVIYTLKTKTSSNNAY